MIRIFVDELEMDLNASPCVFSTIPSNYKIESRKFKLFSETFLVASFSSPEAGTGFLFKLYMYL